MADMPKSQVPRGNRCWAWANPIIEELDNPVRRWLGNRSKENRLQEKHRPQNLKRLIARPAM